MAGAQKPSKQAVATHLTEVADDALTTLNQTLTKLSADARYADCEREFGLALKAAGLDGEVRHFLAAGLLKRLGLD